MNHFLESIYFRHACKLFDDKKKIPQEQFDEILEVGRMAPSSFGMEPTKRRCVLCVGTSHKSLLRVK